MKIIELSLNHLINIQLPPGLCRGPAEAPRGRGERSAAGAVAVRRPQPGQREARQGAVRLRQGTDHDCKTLQT